MMASLSFYLRRRQARAVRRARDQWRRIWELQRAGERGGGRIDGLISRRTIWTFSKTTSNIGAILLLPLFHHLRRIRVRLHHP
ncbi:hypothetical protein BC937DRAFT_87968 [Endogone sp. FLAS-F59071]|nr:hypothetical protein BC937DRAFT_87968 [Endogone sp. FLAS-F59071]|eukprot:RUS10987.1 hypothetical protein BC937DRAFT_87968 [Endogone sp. FLAS-F59071]